MKRIKSLEKKLRHNCPSCQSSYTLLETWLQRKDNQNCQINCSQTWQEIIHKYCQEKVLGQELEQEQSTSAFDKDGENKQNGSH